MKGLAFLTSFGKSVWSSYLETMLGTFWYGNTTGDYSSECGTLLNARVGGILHRRIARCTWYLNKWAAAFFSFEKFRQKEKLKNNK